jgi:hypothetical protein
MDKIRLSQIKEILDYDKNINTMVFNLREITSSYDLSENVLPYVQLNAQALDGLKML